ncbi:hypothetical protein [Paracoccus aestuariivivens]|uniref:Uncharacterized protein n=1 Tax=Paracoccus aestuariivivens TaxID=1820333 RepID=A0A6L6J6S0_9RHOB|nr:hypothetical protein [Paracoccus aestuariivivens]MTH76327.1 hypothetical protein [Paracoccus aestuariivivens]
MKDMDIGIGEGGLDQPRVIFDCDAGGERLAAERERMAAIIARATPAEGCSPRIPISPARGPQVSVTPHVMLPDEKSDDGWKAERTGWRGFKAARAMDIFDDLERRAANRKDKDGNPGVSPFTKGQVNAARRYRDMVERHSAGGMRCSSLEAQRASGPSSGGEFMDAFIAEGDAIAWMRRRIGNGVAMPVRRVRPSARGGERARIIYDRVLVDAICMEGRSFREVLELHGWKASGQNAKAVTSALGKILDRMQFTA